MSPLVMNEDKSVDYLKTVLKSIELYPNKPAYFYEKNIPVKLRFEQIVIYLDEGRRKEYVNKKQLPHKVEKDGHYYQYIYRLTKAGKDFLRS